MSALWFPSKPVVSSLETLLVCERQSPVAQRDFGAENSGYSVLCPQILERSFMVFALQKVSSGGSHRKDL